MSVWYEKHRPTTLDDYVWTDSYTRTKLETWIADPLSHPHLILAGPTGTGKTTLAKIIRSMLDLSSDAIFIPASLRNGVDTIRAEIVGFCEHGGFRGMKLIILDEADRLSQAAQEMLRNVLDRYESDVRFIFTCNHPDRIIDPLQSRVWVVPIEALDHDAFINRLIDIAVKESIDLGPDEAQEILMEIVDTQYPNMRLAINKLQWFARDGTLTRTATITTVAPWEQTLLTIFDHFTVDAARILVTSIHPDEFESVYRVLYENSKMFGVSEPEAIVLIADHLYRHAQAGLPDITLCSCLIRLSELGVSA